MPGQVNRGCEHYAPSIFMQKEGKMRKTIIIIMLSLVLVTGSVLGSEMRAEASSATAVTTGVTLAKALFLLLAMAGVAVSADAIENDNVDVSSFMDSLKTTNPTLYTKVQLWQNAITAGNLSYTITRSYWEQFRDYCRDYFGVSSGVETIIGSYTSELVAVSAGDTINFIYSKGGSPGTLSVTNSNYDMLIFIFGTTESTNYSVPWRYYLCFAPVTEVGADLADDYRSSFTVSETGSAQKVGMGLTNYSNYYANVGYCVEIELGINLYSYFDYLSVSGSFAPMGHYTSTLRKSIGQLIAEYRNSGSVTLEEDIAGTVLEGEDGVASTSSDLTLVGAGNSITLDDNEDVVIDGDLPLNLAGLDIDEWLKNLANGITDYQTAVQALGVDLVDTSTMTQEQIAEIAENLSTTVAGTDYITGNYTVDLTGLFPFCIPFDLYKIVKCFEADPVAPSATITIPVGYDGSTFAWEEYTVSLEDFNQVATVVRVFEYVLFVIGLMLITRKLIEG